jgi:epoxyqueuosine reductase
LGVSYFQGDVPPKPGPAHERMARYTWGADYHDVIGERLRLFIERIKNILGDVNCTLATDTKPVLERALAESAGMGFVGKNTVFIIPQGPARKSAGGRDDGGPRFHVGSWLFLAEIFIDVPLAAEAAPARVENGCGGCTNCLTACPTDAFEGPYKLNAGKCIAYLTIENKGPIPRGMRAALGDWLFGCDKCQDVCPYNARAKQTRWPELEAARGVGAWVDVKDIFSIPDQPSFKKKWGTTPLSRAKRRGLVRNACVVAGNSQDESLIPSIKNLIHDAEPLIRQHALWAYTKLAPRIAKAAVEAALKDDADAGVKKECEDLIDHDY